MNRSMFSASPFRPNYGLEPVRARLGQEGFIEDAGDFLQDIRGLLADLDPYL